MKEIQKSNLDSNDLQSIAKSILDRASQLGASQAEVDIASNKGFSVRAREGDVETVEYHQDKVVEITVYFGKRSGSASLSDLRPEAIASAVQAACHIARFTGEDPYSGLADKSDMAFDYPQLDLGSPWPITVEQAIQLACECEKQALSLDKRIMSAEEVSIGTMSACHVYANSHGFIGTFPSARHEISCVLVAKQAEEMQRDYSYTVSSDPAHLENIANIAKQAVEKTVGRLNSRSLSTTKAPVIFIAEEARGLLGHFAAAIQGGNLYRKSSFLLDCLGKKIFPEFVAIAEYPHLAQALGSAPFDDEGVATRNNHFIVDGVLQTYALSSYSARKLNMKTTGNAGGMHNLIIQPGNKNFLDLLKTMNTGLVITEVMGQGVNLVTGDYSRGASGFWVENGEIQYPVHEITVAGNLKDLFCRMVEVGSDVDVRGNIRTGSILIEEMTIAGT